MHDHENARDRPDSGRALPRRRVRHARQGARGPREMDAVAPRRHQALREETHMRRAGIAALFMLAIAVTLSAAPTVTGTWTMTVEGSPHGNAAMGLTLKQEGTKVTGTFSSGHSADMAVSGEFVNGEL